MAGALREVYEIVSVPYVIGLIGALPETAESTVRRDQSDADI